MHGRVVRFFKHFLSEFAYKYLCFLKNLLSNLIEVW